MFKNLTTKLGSLQHRSISIPIETDEKGYIDKQCPADGCNFLFKINKYDFKDVSKDDILWCPMCRHQAPADHWYTIDQAAHIRAEALKIITGEINQAIRADSQDFNRRQPKNGMLSITMKVNGGTDRVFALPARAAEAMQLEIQCDSCSVHFAVIGSAYFCPACGVDSVIRTFHDSLRKISVKKDNEDIVRTALTEKCGKDEAEITCRSLRETCLTDGVTAFQKYCEGMFKPFGAYAFNAFQRVDQSDLMWKNAIGVGFGKWLSDEEMISLNVLYQKRHLIAHTDGIVDDKYIQKSGDATYKSGQRIVVLKDDIEKLLAFLERLSRGIEIECKKA